jgi:hypothetical protein
MSLVAVVARIHVVAELERPAVGGGEMIGLVEGVDGGLPVAVDLDRAVVGDLPVLEAVRIEMLGHDPQIAPQRLGRRVETDEDEARPGLTAHGLERERPGVEPLRKALRIEGLLEPAVEAVLPTVEETGEALGMTASGLAQAIAPMHADVVARGQGAVGLADHQDRLRPDLEAEVVPGSGTVRLASRTEPGPGPHPLPLEPGELRTRVSLLGNRDRVECRIRRGLHRRRHRRTSSNSVREQGADLGVHPGPDLPARVRGRV